MEFRTPSLTDQEKSIAATIDDLQVAIEHHVAQSPRRLVTIERFLTEIDRIRDRLKDEYDRKNAQPGVPAAAAGAGLMPTIHLRSPRLARPELASDFTMEVTEVTPDALL